MIPLLLERRYFLDPFGPAFTASGLRDEVERAVALVGPAVQRLMQRGRVDGPADLRPFLREDCHLLPQSAFIYGLDGHDQPPRDPLYMYFDRIAGGTSKQCARQLL